MLVLVILIPVIGWEPALGVNSPLTQSQLVGVYKWYTVDLLDLQTKCFTVLQTIIFVWSFYLNVQLQLYTFILHVNNVIHSSWCISSKALLISACNIFQIVMRLSSMLQSNQYFLRIYHVYAILLSIHAPTQQMSNHHPTLSMMYLSRGLCWWHK